MRCARCAFKPPSRCASTMADAPSPAAFSDYFTMSGSISRSSPSSVQSKALHEYHYLAPVLSSPLVPWFNPSLHFLDFSGSYNFPSSRRRSFDLFPSLLITPPEQSSQFHRQSFATPCASFHSSIASRFSETASSSILPQPENLWPTLNNLPECTSPYHPWLTIEQAEKVLLDIRQAVSRVESECASSNVFLETSLIEAVVRLFAISRLFHFKNKSIAERSKDLMLLIRDRFALQSDALVAHMCACLQDPSHEIPPAFWDDFESNFLRHHGWRLLFDIMMHPSTTFLTQPKLVKRFFQAISHPKIFRHTIRKFEWLLVPTVPYAHDRIAHSARLILDYIPEPDVWFSSSHVKGSLSQMHQRNLFQVLINCLSRSETSHVAFRVWSRNPTLDVPSSLHCGLFMSLDKAHRGDLTKQMIGSLEKHAGRIWSLPNDYDIWHSNPDYKITNAYHFMKALDFIQTSEDVDSQYFSNDFLSHFSVPQLFGIMQKLSENVSAPAIVEKVATVIRLLTPKPYWRTILGPACYAYTIQAYTLAQKYDAAQERFDQLLEEGMRPNVGCFKGFMRGHVQRKDVQGMLDTWRRLNEFHLKPTLACYKYLVRLFCAVRQPGRALDVIQRMQRETSIAPSLGIMTVLMEGYVEVRQWNNAIRIFRNLEQHPDSLMKPGYVVKCILLKAYVGLGVPLTDIFTLFKFLRSENPADPYTYSLILQAAWDAHRDAFAEKIFAEMRSQNSKCSPNVFHYEIMIKGNLRSGKERRARQLHLQMMDAGIKSTAHTSPVFMPNRAPARDLREVDEVGYNISRQGSGREMLWSVGDQRLDPSGVYQPLMRAAARNMDTESIREICRKISQDANEPTPVPKLSVLLNACEQVGDIESMLRVWEVMYRHARSLAVANRLQQQMSATSNENDFRLPTEIQEMLSPALSTVIIALANSGHYHKIRNIWEMTRLGGFGFSPFNWNALAIAFTKAAHISRAFWIVEEVLFGPEEVTGNTSTDIRHFTFEGTFPEVMGESDDQKEINLLSESFLGASSVDSSGDRTAGRVPFTAGHDKRSSKKVVRDRLSHDSNEFTENDEDIHTDDRDRVREAVDRVVEAIFESSEEMKHDLTREFGDTRGVSKWMPTEDLLLLLDQALHNIANKSGRARGSLYDQFVKRFPKAMEAIASLESF